MKTFLKLSILIATLLPWHASAKDVNKTTDTEKDAYLFVFHQDPTSSLYMATSRDGYTFTALNNGRPVMSGDTLATQHGIRDPHIYRGPEGAFYLAMTDLNLSGKEMGFRDTRWERDQDKYGWGNNHGFILMKSYDLINWTKSVAHIDKMFPGLDVGCAWAPETIYDPEEDMMMIYFTMRLGNGKTKLYYSYTDPEFTRLVTKPKELFKYPDPEIQILDADISRMPDGRYCLMYVAQEQPGGIKMAFSDKINRGYKYSDQWADTEPGACEAPNVWKRNGENKRVLMYDIFSINPHNFGFAETTDFKTFKDLGHFNEGPMKTTNFTSPKHGAIITITKDQAEKLEEYWADKVCVDVDMTKPVEPMKPLWAWFGYDEPNYTYMKDGRRLLTEISRLSPVPVNVRAHNLLTSGDGEAALKWGSTNIYTEDRKGRPVYQWNIIDSIFDTYVARGMRPLVQIGFTPEALSTNPQPYRHHWTPDARYDEIFTGWAYPPNDYNKWRDLVYNWAQHCKERYGEDEVSKWYWEVWNEPNGYLRGSFEDYCKIYDYAADGLLKALPEAVIGGPHSTGPGDRNAREYLRKFLQHCIDGTNYATGGKGAPLGYIGFHAKGSPRLDGKTVVMRLGSQLNDVDAGLRLISEFPEFKGLPVIIGEFDPEGCAACSSEYTPQYNYRNGTMYSSTMADSYARLYELARKYDANLAGAVTWAFEFEDQPWFAGFRDLSTNGVVKPVLNVFRMFGQMGGDLVEASSTGMIPVDSIVRNSVRDMPDVGVLASRDGRNASVLLWNYHDVNDTDVTPADIDLKVNVGNDTKRVLVTRYCIDDSHSNSYSKWIAMGCPQNPDDTQLRELQRAGELEMSGSPEWKSVDRGTVRDRIVLPRQGVVLMKMELR